MDFKGFLNLAESVDLLSQPSLQSYWDAIQIPTVSRQSRVSFVERNKNPIFVCLEDGTKLHFTWDQFKRLNKEPKQGSVVKVEFQRHPTDKSAERSQIHRITVL